MKTTGFNSYKYRFGRCSGWVAPLLAFGVLASSATTSGGDGNRRDSYAELAQTVRDGLEIEVDLRKKVVHMRDGGKIEETLQRESLHAWVRSIAGSPGVREALADFSPEQKVILDTFSAIDRMLSSLRELQLHGELLRFYCLHLESRNEAVRELALGLMIRKRWEHNNFKPYLNDEMRGILLKFVEKYPTFGGETDERGKFQNGITLVGISGGGEDAIELLESLAGTVPGFEFSRTVALARLDNTRAKEFINEYEEEKELSRKIKLARALGQISTPDTLRVLARDLRSGLTMGGQKGMGYNQYVLAALCLAKDWPEDGPWLGKVGVYGEADFEMAEAWCVEKFNMEWDRPKPPVRKMRKTSF